jgi:hypothetical protein
VVVWWRRWCRSWGLKRRTKGEQERTKKQVVKAVRNQEDFIPLYQCLADPGVPSALTAPNPTRQAVRGDERVLPDRATHRYANYEQYL